MKDDEKRHRPDGVALPMRVGKNRGCRDPDGDPDAEGPR